MLLKKKEYKRKIKRSYGRRTAKREEDEVV